MDLVLASNFDDALIDGAADLPVSTFFGNFPVSLTGGGRPPRILPAVDPDRFRAHVDRIHRSGRAFYATINSSDLDLKEYRPGFAEAFDREIGGLLDLGADGFVVALPLLIETIRREHPSVPISVSTFARVRTVTQAEYFLGLGADTIVIEEANRDFRLLRGLVRAGARVELLVNQTCIASCPYRAHHLNTSSLAAQPDHACPMFEYPLIECGLEMVRDPAKLVASILVRPEDLEVYEEIGVTRFKVSGRNRSTAWLLRAARAYAERRYSGNLLDILSFVQVRGPRAALQEVEARPGPVAPAARPLREAFAALSDVVIDNAAYPPGFLRRVASTDCAHIACSECGYCARVAEEVLTIGGRPLNEYRAPVDLPSPISLLPYLGAASAAPAEGPPPSPAGPPAAGRLPRAPSGRAKQAPAG
jgi:collagenase-like PrtC family protease